MMNKYYSLVKENNTATINIYGDITSFPWFESDNEVTASNLSDQLKQLKDVDEICVYINSYGGEVAEGLAIYNELKRHKAKVKTYCDGFACSIASVIFMAGDERVMNDSSLLMIHNAWTLAEGNAKELRKQADDLEKITQASVVAYKAHSTLSEEKIVELMDNETWILPEEAVEYGFATGIEKTENKKASQSVKAKVLEMIKGYKQEAKPEEAEDTEEEPNTEEEPDTDTEEEPDTEDEGEEPEDEQPEDEGEEEEKAAQKWSGFFNAIFKD